MGHSSLFGKAFRKVIVTPLGISQLDWTICGQLHRTTIPLNNSLKARNP
jgi:hypothetical protein